LPDSERKLSVVSVELLSGKLNDNCPRDRKFARRVNSDNLKDKSAELGAFDVSLSEEE